MYGDFSRLTFDPERSYSAVWMQQGRVQLDSDDNERTAILLHHLRTLTVDLLGPFAAAFPGNGFKISLPTDNPGDLLAAAGHYYVHGLRCELNEPLRYRAQYNPTGIPALPAPPFVVELVVWEQTVSALQNPGLLEPALGPNAPDTTVRSQVKFRLDVAPEKPDGSELAGDETPDDLARAYLDATAARGQGPVLRARVRRGSAPGGEERTPRTPTPGGYRGPENQLYRIEVHTGGPAGTATFKWSADNGSVTFALRDVEREGDDVTAAKLVTRAADQRSDLQENDWVELQDDSWSPLAEPAPLLQITRYDRDLAFIELAGPEKARPQRIDGTLHPFVRRWDQRVDVNTPDNAVPIPHPLRSDDECEWIDLEDGIQIQFSDPHAYYEPRDYWLVPARASTGGLLWPTDPANKPLQVTAARQPVYRAPLALITSLDNAPQDLRFVAGQAVAWHSAPATAEPVPDWSDAANAAATTVLPKIAKSLVRLTMLPVDEPDASATSATQAATPVTFELKEGTTTMGRSLSNQIRLSDESVSHNHATITVTADGNVTITDLGSTNGTFVNDQEINGPTSLHDNDIIRLSHVPLRVNILS